MAEVTFDELYDPAQVGPVSLPNARDTHKAALRGKLSVIGTLAGMTALTKASLSDGDTIRVQAEGTGGVFRWDASSTATADGGIIFASDEGGAGRWVRQYEGPVWAHYYDAKGDGATDDTAALAAWLAGPGPWAIRQGTGKYITNAPLVLAHEQVIQCVGLVKVKAGPTFTGSAVLKSADFDTLTGSNKWFFSEGVPSGFGWTGELWIDGENKAIKGIQFYGKGLRAEYGKIKNVKGGWYSECADKGGQQGMVDMPEGKIGTLKLRQCAPASGDVAFEYNGPHDGHVHSVNARGNDAMPAGAIGLKIGQSDGVYNGTIDIDSIHVYGFDRNLVQDASFKCLRCISESALSTAMELNAPTGQKVIVAQAELYNNARVTKDYNIKITGFGVIVSDIVIGDSNDGGGISLTGGRHKISGRITGSSGTKIGVELNADQCILDMAVTGYSGTGGLGFRDGASVACNGNQGRFVINNCNTGWEGGTRGYGNVYDFSGNLVAGQAIHAGNRPRAGGLEMVRLSMLANGVAKVSHHNFTASGVVDLTSTAVQTIAMSHSCYAQPYIQHATAIMTGGTAGIDDFAVQYMRIAGTSATQVTVELKLATASATGGAVANLGVSAFV